MANGGTIYAGRAPAMLYGGRSVSSLSASMQSLASWSRGHGLCVPTVQCCCKGPWTIAPGEQLALTITWANWLADPNGGPPLYFMNKVDEASLYDMTSGRPTPADPEEIRVVTGIAADDPDEFDNADVADLINLRPPFATEVFILASKDARIGSQYRLSMCVLARDCEGRLQRMCDCFVITVAEC
jgi:hypothetical protein